MHGLIPNGETRRVLYKKHKVEYEWHVPRGVDMNYLLDHMTLDPVLCSTVADRFGILYGLRNRPLSVFLPSDHDLNDGPSLNNWFSFPRVTGPDFAYQVP